MRPLPATVLALSVICAALPAAAQSHAWSKKFEEDGIAVYSRQSVSGSLHEVRMVAEIDAPPRACRNVLADNEAHPETLPNTAETRVVAREGDRVTWVYSLLDLPVVSNRDVTLRSVEEELRGPRAGYRIRFTVANDRGPPPRDGVVRIELCTGSWEFMSIDGGRRTQAVYTLLVDPGGLIPAFLANKATRQSLPNVFRAIRRWAQDPRYADPEPASQDGRVTRAEATTER